jgi:sarcosine oxidase
VQRVDAVVVGTGVMGAATAWSLARRGRDVVALDRFGPGHDRGSSHGGSRIFRLAYPDPAWVELAMAARAGWRAIADEAGEPLLTPTGSVDTGDPGAVAAIAAALAAAGAPAEPLDPAEASARWPGITFAPPVLHQPDGGRVAAAAAWSAFTAQAARHGAVVRWETPVAAIEPQAGRVLVVTDDETYDARVAVVAAGAWLEPLLRGLAALPPLVVTQESAFHFAPRDEATDWPSFILHGAGPAGAAVYGLETPGEGVKVAEHHTGPVTTADRRDFTVDAASRARVIDVVRRRLPGLDPTLVSEVTCLYTSTPDEEFVIERTGPLVVVSACSGHGFKFAPEIGRRAAALAFP